MRTRLKVILLPGVLVAWLCCANPAAADSASTVNPQDLSTFDGLGDVPPADLTGWFLTFDPSDQWTSAANIATMESLLTSVEELNGDPSLLTQLDGLGMNDPSSPTLQAAVISTIPEPATLELIGGSLTIFGLCTCKRVRGISETTYVSLRRFDRSHRS